MDTLAGHLLVATMELSDPNFLRTVVLLVRHTEEGALGVILNRVTEAKLKEVWEQVSESECQSEQLLHRGGPCPGPLMAVHTRMHLAELQVLPGVYFSTAATALSELVADTDHEARFYVGYAGWGPGQLESEIAAGGWTTAPATMDDVFDDPHDQWLRVLRRVSSSALVEMLRIKNPPNDPRLN